MGAPTILTDSTAEVYGPAVLLRQTLFNELGVRLRAAVGIGVVVAAVSLARGG